MSNSVLSNIEMLTLKQFARRYRMSNRTARTWIESGKAPGQRIPGCRRYVIFVAECDAFDRDPTNWTRPIVVQAPAPRPETTYLRRVG